MPKKDIKQQGTQDFFPRSGSNTTKTKGFIFNQAPLNKNQAKEEAKTKVADTAKSHKRSAFIAKLYQDDDDQFDDEMKVFDINAAADSNDEEAEQKPKKRQAKEQSKSSSGKQVKSHAVVATKINRLKFSPGSVGLFAIAEIHPTYLIVNYTRNTKGFVSLEKNEELHKHLEIGQYIVASVISAGTAKYNVQTNGHQNKKLQLAIDLENLNKSLTCETISPNMLIQGIVESKEAKGFLINFGLKDKAKGFLPFTQDNEHLQIGSIIPALVKSVIAGSKVIKCEQVTKDNAFKSFVTNKELTIHNLKPGFLVNAKVSKLLDNGIEVNFLGGFNGSIFIDHLDKDDASKYKIGEKLSARIISIDPQTQNVSLSCLSHIIKCTNIKDNLLNEGFQVGKVFEQAQISRVIFGDSFKVKVGSTNIEGFLHKIHSISNIGKEDEEDDEAAKVSKTKKVELQKGSKLSKVRVKELNYFDGYPVLSMRDDIVGSNAINYDQIKCGMFVSVTIEEVNEKDKCVTLKLNDFVKGRLYLEHMADFPLKVLPPKFTKVGKQIKVRVFYVDAEKRYLEFTKKETLMKEKTPVYQSYKEANKGSKIVGVVVDQNDYGFVVKSFGGIKGLLTFQDIKDNAKSTSKKDYKIGSILKAYVLFRKKEKGMALTLDKSKAKELRKEIEEKQESRGQSSDNVQHLSFDQYLPTTKEIDEIKEKYKSLIKASSNLENIGSVMKFRVVEQKERYYLCKSIDAAKKSQNIVAILPKCLFNKFCVPSLSVETFSFEGMVLEHGESGLTIISGQSELISLKDSIPKSNEDVNNQANRTFVGLISEILKNGIQIRFLDGLKKLILVKDVDNAQEYKSLYQIGQVVRTSKNKLDRLTLKTNVIYANDASLSKTDKQVQIQTLYKAISKNLEYHQIKIGEVVSAEVSLVKDYGNIVSVDKYPTLTGFILSEHLMPGKTYKEGQKLNCLVMDIDFEKEIIDLSEKLGQPQKQDQKLKEGSSYKAVVELNKDDYLLVSFKQNKHAVGLLMMQPFNNDQSPHPNANLQMGDEIDVIVTQVSEQGFILTIPATLEEDKSKKLKTKQENVLAEGSLVTGHIRSIKNQCAFLQLVHQSQMVIGRLHRLECQSDSEFAGFSVGEQLQAKILKISQDKKKTWIELTRRREHMQKTQGLDAEALTKTILKMEDLKNNKQYEALIMGVNYAYSSPLHISLSPFVKGSINFDSIVDAQTLLKEGSSYLKKYHEGTKIQVYYKNGSFYLSNSNTDQKQKEKVNKGDLVVVRAVKGIPGKGVAVQISQNLYGFIEICELSDDLIGSIISETMKNQPLFVARVVGFEKNDKPILSARDSIVDEKKWELVGPSGKSIHFQKFDEKNQSLGNLRNKIIKYGASVALHEGDLCLGYITNIGKAGCFVQIGHNTTVRAGLNELSDSSSFNYSEQLPLGRIVLGRVIKIDDKSGQKRYNITLRKSLVIYGINAVDRASLQQDAQVQCHVLAVVDGKAYAQIKGSSLKVKVKDIKDGQLAEGDSIVVKLQKVTHQKIVGTLEGKLKSLEMDSSEKKIEKLWNSIDEESQKDIEAMKDAQNQAIIDHEKLKELGQQIGEEDEIDVQYKDLKELEQDEESMEIVQNDDSDAEEMQRIIRESKIYEDDDEEDKDKDNEKMQDESAEEDEDDSDEEMKDADDEEEKHEKKKSGKQSLKSRIREEQEIRKKEQQLRANTDQPASVDDFERLLVQNQDQSYVWIQYMAFLLDKLGIEAARRVAERAVKSVSISNEEDKFNIWVAFMNLENNFGTQETLQGVVKRALEVNDRKRIYLQLISMYQTSHKYQYIEDIYKQLCKKFNTSLEVWSGYLDFLFQVKQLKREKSSPQHFLVVELEVSDPKQVLQRALQSLPKDLHVNIISKFGMLEFKHGQPENGRTMFEGIVTNYPKRMDIWSIYMDMEVKYGGDNKQQARHLFERCLSNEFIQKKPKKMKLVFQKYMEYEMQTGNKKNVDKLRERVEEYLEKAFKKEEGSEGDSD